MISVFVRPWIGKSLRQLVCDMCGPDPLEKRNSIQQTCASCSQISLQFVAIPSPIFSGALSTSAQQQEHQEGQQQ